MKLDNPLISASQGDVSRAQQRAKIKNGREQLKKTTIQPSNDSDMSDDEAPLATRQQSGKHTQAQAEPNANVTTTVAHAAATAAATLMLEELPVWMSNAVQYLRTDISQDAHWIRLVDC